MDLDDFDASLAALSLDDEPVVQTQSARDAVTYIDKEWYTFVNRRGRRMDLIGDYAGSEPFIVDGMYTRPLSGVRSMQCRLISVLWQAKRSFS